MLVVLFKKGSDKERKNIYDAYLDHTDTINNGHLIDSSAGLTISGKLGDDAKPYQEKLVKQKTSEVQK